MLWRSWAWIMVMGGLGLLFLAGCGGPSRLPVAGTVTLDGKPVSAGLLRFLPDESRGNTARVSCSAQIKDGRYELQTAGITRDSSGPGALPGWYRVTVVPRLPGKPPLEVNPKFLSTETTPLQIEIVDRPAPGAYDIVLTR